MSITGEASDWTGATTGLSPRAVVGGARPGYKPAAVPSGASHTRAAGAISPGGFYEIAVSDTAVWVHDGEAGTSTRIDPATNTVVATIHVGHGEGAVGLERCAVWVLNKGERGVPCFEA